MDGAGVRLDFPVSANRLYARSEDNPRALELSPWFQNSPVIASDPQEPRFVVLANRFDGPEFSCGLQLSGDGGRGWIRAEPVPELPAGAERCYAPEVAFDGDGVLYYLFIGLRGRGNEPMGVFLTRSSDRGRTFTRPRKVLGPDNYQVRMAIDPSAGESARIHLVWLHSSADAPTGGLPPPPNPILAAYSDDEGETFSRPTQVSDPARPRSLAPALALGPDHSVHVVYYDLREDFRDYQGLEGAAWTGRWSLVTSSSFDGGKSFGRGGVVNAALVPPERVMLIFTMPPASLVADQSGRLYAAWHDARNGDWDVFVSRSTDVGRSWSRPLRANDDARGNGRHQYLPRLSLAPDGRLDTAFYDRRNDPKNVRNDVYFASSQDGGASFSRNLKLTSESSSSRIGQRYAVPSAKGQVEFGSRLGLLSRATGALAAWTDTRNTTLAPQQDIFATEFVMPTTEAGGGITGGWSSD